MSTDLSVEIGGVIGFGWTQNDYIKIPSKNIFPRWVTTLEVLIV